MPCKSFFLVSKPAGRQALNCLQDSLAGHPYGQTKGLVAVLEREAERGKQRKGVVVVAGGGDERDVHTTGAVDLIVLDLGENQLLGDAKRVVAATVEAGRGDATEVADARQSSGQQTIQELPHGRRAG